MKLALRHLLIGALFLIVGFGAQAQEDEVVERYGLALTNLSESMNLLSSDLSASRDELDRAAGALRYLASQAGSPSLVSAMERVFERARTAIANRSMTDLGVQTSLLRGGFQRALYDSALALLEEDTETARVRLNRLAADLRFDQETRASLAQASDRAEVRRAFEAAVAERIEVQLLQAQERYAQGQDEAYRSLANAYADFLLIQDSPRANAELNAEFAGAAQGLVEDRGEQANEQLASLAQSFDRLAEAARAEPVPGEDAVALPEAAVEGGEETAEQGVGESQAAPSQEVDAAEAGAAAPAEDESNRDASETAAEAAAEATPGTPGEERGAEGAGETAGEALAQDAPARNEAAGEEAAGNVSAGEGAAGQEGAGQEAAAAEGRVAGEAGERDSARAEEARRVLARELLAAGVPAARVDSLAASLRQQDVSSLGDAIATLYAEAGRFTAARQAGANARAREAAGNFRDSYTRQLRPVMLLLSPALDRRTLGLANGLIESPAPRSQDGVVLLGQVDALAQRLTGEQAPRFQAAAAETTMLWSGWVRLVALIVLAVLAIVPLYLLNLAFGGGNRNWQLIGVALLLLLLPVIYEGVISLATLVTVFVDAPALAAVESMSIFQSPVGQVAWVITTVAAIVFACAGLYGICVQFGLIGSRRVTPGDSQTMISRPTAPDTDTVVDWDEEF